MEPRFSVLLPTHDRPDVLGFAIASVLAQTEPSFELLIVADGCDERTARVVAGFDDPRIRFFDLPKAPHFGYANRNVALRTARGRLMAYAAHDDLMMPDHLALMGEALDRLGAEWGYSQPLWVSTDGVVVPFGTNLMLPDELHHFMTAANTIPANCIVYARALHARVGHWPEHLPEAADWALWRRMLNDGARRTYLPVPTIFHFSADWKKSRFSGMAQVRALLEIADGAAWWPKLLRYMKAEEPEQATLARAMLAGGPHWPEAVRAAVQTVVTRVFWDVIRATPSAPDLS